MCVRVCVFWLLCSELTEKIKFLLFSIGVLFVAVVGLLTRYLFGVY